MTKQKKNKMKEIKKMNLKKIKMKTISKNNMLFSIVPCYLFLFVKFYNIAYITCVCLYVNKIMYVSYCLILEQRKIQNIIIILNNITC